MIDNLMNSSTANASDPVQLSDTISQSKGVVGCELDGELVLMGVETGKYYGFNGVLTKIWSLMQNPVTVGQLHKQLVEMYDVSESVCRQELLKVLADMNKDGLIVVY